MPNTDYDQAKKIKQRLMRRASQAQEDSLIVSFAIGYTVKTIPSQDIIQIEKSADRNMYRHKSKYGKHMRKQTIEAVLSNIFYKNELEEIHAERVSLYSHQIAIAMGLSSAECEDARMAGLLHDIGKITIPDDILNKSEKLSKNEWEEIKRHTITSYNILKGADEYASLAEGVLYHHERPDGKGYPEGLQDNEIPLLSKIIAVADAYESMTSNRHYRRTKTREEASKELQKFSGRQFDPEVVDVFINKVINMKNDHRKKLDEV